MDPHQTPYLLIELTEPAAAAPLIQLYARPLSTQWMEMSKTLRVTVAPQTLPLPAPLPPVLHARLFATDEAHTVKVSLATESTPLVGHTKANKVIFPGTAPNPRYVWDAMEIGMAEEDNVYVSWAGGGLDFTHVARRALTAIGEGLHRRICVDETLNELKRKRESAETDMIAAKRQHLEADTALMLAEAVGAPILAADLFAEWRAAPQ